jgi:anti-sigma regulatory factor (Ser/Thr protein kinase)
VKYGEHGVIRLRHEQTPRAALVVEAIDHGRGIADVEAAFSDGHSRGEKLSPDRDRKSQQGLGVGLGSVQRLMDSVDVNSRDNGTHIVAKKLIA